MNKYEIVKRIEEFAPLETQEAWDASGWVVDLPNAEVNKVMFALTVTPQVYNQAVHKGCDMIISHHPLFFVPYNFLPVFRKAHFGKQQFLTDMRAVLENRMN